MRIPRFTNENKLLLKTIVCLLLIVFIVFSLATIFKAFHDISLNENEESRPRIDNAEKDLKTLEDSVHYYEDGL